MHHASSSDTLQQPRRQDAEDAPGTTAQAKAARSDIAGDITSMMLPP